MLMLMLMLRFSLRDCWMDGGLRILAKLVPENPGSPWAHPSVAEAAVRPKVAEAAVRPKVAEARMTRLVVLQSNSRKERAVRLWKVAEVAGLWWRIEAAVRVRRAAQAVLPSKLEHDCLRQSGLRFCQFPVGE